MKKLLKSGICESVNSAQVHCLRLIWSNNAAGKKKKNQKTQPRIQLKTLNPNGHIETNNLMTLRNQIDPKIEDLNWVFAFFDRYFTWFAYCSFVTSSHIVDGGKCSWIVHVWHVASKFFYFLFFMMRDIWPAICLSCHQFVVEDMDVLDCWVAHIFIIKKSSKDRITIFFWVTFVLICLCDESWVIVSSQLHHLRLVT